MTRRPSRVEKVALATVVGSMTTVIGSYLGLPAVMALIGRLRPKPVNPTQPLPANLTVVIAAHNEQADLPDKLTDLQHQQLPPDTTMTVIVASDGSTDHTAQRARNHPLQPTVLDLPRSGKAAALNTAVQHLPPDIDIVIFSDANSRLEPDTLTTLITPFADPTIGGVAGRQIYGNPATSGNAESDYWAYEDQLKRAESSAGNVVSATGSLYAIRTPLIDPIPPDVTDDFYLSTGVIAHGHRLVYQPDAVAWEDAATNPNREYHRKVRIITGGLFAVNRRRSLLNPVRYPGYAPVLFLHKVVRRLLFIPIGATFIALPALRNLHPVFKLATLASTATAAAATLAITKPDNPIARLKPLRLLTHLLTVNTAAAHAVYNFIRSNRYEQWTTNR